MRRPRDLRHRRATLGEAQPLEVWLWVPIAVNVASQPREWRRAAAWLRRVADWWDYLADEQEMKQTRPWRRLWVCEEKEEGR